MKGKITPFKIVVVVVFLLCLAAFNAGYGSKSQSVDFGFRFATFIIFLGIVWYVAGGIIKGFFKGRSEGISKELSDLENAKIAAEAKLKEAEKLVLGLENEKKSIIDNYISQGEAIKADIIAKAQVAASQIIEQSKLAAQSELDKSIQQIREELAEEIISATEKMLQDKLSNAEHTRLIDKSLNKVVLH